MLNKLTPMVAVVLLGGSLLTGCGAANEMTMAPRMQAASLGAMGKAATLKACPAMGQRYGSVGTFTITGINGKGTWAGSPTLHATLAATADSPVKGCFKGDLVLDFPNKLDPAKLTVGTVIKGFVDYTCVVNNTIQPFATPYTVTEIQIVSGR